MEAVLVAQFRMAVLCSGCGLCQITACLFNYNRLNLPLKSGCMRFFSSTFAIFESDGRHVRETYVGVQINA